MDRSAMIQGYLALLLTGHKLIYDARVGGEQLAGLAEAYELHLAGDEDCYTRGCAATFMFYVNGVLDATMAPREMTTATASKAVSAYLRANPHLWHMAAVALVEAAVINAVHCAPKKKTSAPRRRPAK
jgi:hypothetical protein